MTTFITRIAPVGDGPTLAVKDLIDVEGVPTTAGSLAISADAPPAPVDAVCLAGARMAGARIVGKTNLHELAFGTTGINKAFGTPENPFDRLLLPGGSSSGSAVAVALGDAELALGSDTGGSIRIPSAFCGTTGLKTTFGRIPVAGTRPLAPSLDTIGPMARDVAGVAKAMALLEPGFVVAAAAATRIGRLRPGGVEIEPSIDRAVDAALAAAGFTVIDIALTAWNHLYARALDLLLYEAAVTNAAIIADPARRERLGDDVRDRLAVAVGIDAGAVARARAAQASWSAWLDDVWRSVEVLALPTVGCYPPKLVDAIGPVYNALTIPFNFSGSPASAQPIAGGPIPASLQLVGAHGSESLLLATAAVVEAAAGSILS